MDCNFWIFIAAIPCFLQNCLKGYKKHRKHYGNQPLAAYYRGTDKFLRLSQFLPRKYSHMVDSTFRLRPSHLNSKQTKAGKFATIAPKFTILTDVYLLRISRFEGKCWDTLPQRSLLCSGNILASKLVVDADSIATGQPL